MKEVNTILTSAVYL